MRTLPALRDHAVRCGWFLQDESNSQEQWLALIDPHAVAKLTVTEVNGVDGRLELNLWSHGGKLLSTIRVQDENAAVAVVHQLQEARER